MRPVSKIRISCSKRPPHPPGIAAGSRWLWLGVLLIGLTSVGCSDADLATESQVVDLLQQPRDDRQVDELQTRGRQLFLRHSCHNCHGTDLHGNLGVAPPLRGLYLQPATLIDGSQIQRDPAYLARSILHPQQQIVAGYSQPMSSYRHLPADEVAAIITYLHRFSPPPDTPEQAP